MGIYNYDVLCHHGIKGQKWGIRRYQNEDGSLTIEGRKRYGAPLGWDLSNKKVRKVAGKEIDQNNKDWDKYFKSRNNEDYETYKKSKQTLIDKLNSVSMDFASKEGKKQYIDDINKEKNKIVSDMMKEKPILKKNFGSAKQIDDYDYFIQVANEVCASNVEELKSLSNRGEMFYKKYYKELR